MKQFFKIASIRLAYSSLQRHEASGVPNIQNCSQARLSGLSCRKARTRHLDACKTSRALLYLFFVLGKFRHIGYCSFRRHSKPLIKPWVFSAVQKPYEMQLVCLMWCSHPIGTPSFAFRINRILYKFVLHVEYQKTESVSSSNVTLRKRKIFSQNLKAIICLEIPRQSK